MSLYRPRTEDGRCVSFRHDEIRDWYGNIRLDHGYALTITSAQGLTVDWTFLLADARPSRETIYPAATRHREGLDIYVNRAPLALDIADRRADNDREVAVTDTEIRAWLAERWSRSRPKAAALDYMADGIWEDRRENVRENRSRSPGETRDEKGEVRAAANDNALASIARDVRRTAFGWRHAQAVSTFVDGHRQVLAAYDDLRERTRTQGDAVALGGAFRETLNRHAVLLKQAAAFRARPGDFASLLAKRGGIGRKDLDAFEDLHARARRHRRAATMRHVHRIKRGGGTGSTTTETRIAARGVGAGGRPRRSAPACRYGKRGTRPGCSLPIVTRRRPGTSTPSRRSKPKITPGHTPRAAQEDVPPPMPSHDHATVQSESAVTPPDAAAPLTDAEPAKPDWLAPYEAFQRDWNELIERVQQTGEPLFYAKGYAAMIPRIQALAENPDIAAEKRAPMIEALENHQRDLSARKHVEDYLGRRRTAHGHACFPPARRRWPRRSDR